MGGQAGGEPAARDVGYAPDRARRGPLILRTRLRNNHLFSKDSTRLQFLFVFTLRSRGGRSWWSSSNSASSSNRRSHSNGSDREYGNRRCERMPNPHSGNAWAAKKTNCDWRHSSTGVPRWRNGVEFKADQRTGGKANEGTRNRCSDRSCRSRSSSSTGSSRSRSRSRRRRSSSSSGSRSSRSSSRISSSSSGCCSSGYCSVTFCNNYL